MSSNQLAIAAFALILLGVYISKQTEKERAKAGAQGGTKLGGGSFSTLGNKQNGTGLIKTGIVYYEDYFPRGQY